jgi:hypothetical protein
MLFNSGRGSTCFLTPAKGPVVRTPCFSIPAKGPSRTPSFSTPAKGPVHHVFQLWQRVPYTMFFQLRQRFRTTCFSMDSASEVYRNHLLTCTLVGSLKMNTTLEYSTRVVQEGDRRCKKSTLNDLVYLTPLRIPLMNPVMVLSFLSEVDSSCYRSKPFSGQAVSAGCRGSSVSSGQSSSGKLG